MPVYCFECNKLYSTQSNLNKHLKVVNKKTSQVINYAFDIKYRCQSCNGHFKCNNDLRKHLESQHDFENVVEELHFENYSAFTQWLSEEDDANQVQYAQNTGKKSKAEFDLLYYECRRSYRNRKDKVLPTNRKRSLKSQGSCKIDKASCVSQIIVKKNKHSGECFVTYYKSHYLHGRDVQHLQISKANKNVIASKLILGVPAKGIINSNRESAVKTEDLKRIFLLTSKDIQNIKKSYKIAIKDGCRHHSEAVSVDLWVTECTNLAEANPVLFYKAHGHKVHGFGETDFCLIIMNNVQKKILRDFGPKAVTIDGTHGLNSYDFELTTLLVLDENRQGFPVAFMFSNRKNTDIYKIFFSKIKDVGQICTKVFMSNITDTYFNAWCSIMGAAEKRLLCSWHVDRAWQSNLTKMRHEEKRSWVYKTNKSIQSLLSKSVFEEKFAEFLQAILEDEDTRLFGQYIEKYYLYNCKDWAYCYRSGGGLNTNMHLESFHKTLKYYYLDGKKIKRLDKTIHQLMLFLRDKVFERIIYLKKGKTLENTIVSRHRVALTIQFEIQKNETMWILKGMDASKSYAITKISNSICCLLKCSFCNICVHSYTCSCTDFVIKTTICKHIHFLVINIDQLSLRNPNIQIVVTNRNDENNMEVSQLLKTAIGTSTTSSEDTVKSKIKSNCWQIIESLGNDNINSQNFNLILENTNVSVALSKINLKLNCNKMEFETISNDVKEPSNKKITKQVSFFSTKKKTMKNMQNLKSSADDKKVINEFINNVLVTSRDPSNDDKYV